ncbi:hypothetical protein PTTW11_09818 [Pyrenophora teres f. teres]|uniref:Uncharacterized protein n=1 Tax=Pyrenophora teres f. teres TaxID=97479 RepID=A0A6S6WIC8_9PLEO|nr:hypothetical protein PTTW11_09818 [Pyrenophora teres f. teres]
MKFSAILALAAASVAMASPAVASLERSVKEVRNAAVNVAALSCVECPCNGFSGACTCIPNGCCCK